MSTGAVNSNTIYYDHFNDTHDAGVNNELIDALPSQPTTDTSDYNPTETELTIHVWITESKTDGSFSTAEDPSGNKFYVGGFSSMEGPNGKLDAPETYKFYVQDGAHEAAVIERLQEAGLIPEWVTNLDQLGDKGIGVVENAVEMGVLEVQEGGALMPTDADVGSLNPTSGALVDQNVVEGDDGGVIFVTDSAQYTDEHGNQITVVQGANGAFYVDNGDGKFTHVNSAAYEAMFSGDGSFTAQDVIDKFASKELRFDAHGQVEAYAVDGTQLTANAYDEAGTLTGSVRREVSSANNFYYYDAGDPNEELIPSAIYTNVGLSGSSGVKDFAVSFEQGRISFNDTSRMFGTAPANQS